MTEPSVARREAAAPVEVLRRLRAAGVHLSVTGGTLRYSAPSGALTAELRTAARACRDELAALVGAEAATGGEWTFTTDPDAAGEPFALTDLQQAYLVGEQEFYEHAGPAAFVHEYEFAVGAAPQPDRIDAALRRLRQAHGALRLAISTDGTQRIVPDDGASLLERFDLAGLPQATASHRLAELSAALVTNLPPQHAGRPLRAVYIRLPGGRVRLQLALRLTSFDGVTTQLFLSELARCCAQPGYRVTAPALTFRDYVQGLRAHADSPAYAAGRRHWDERLAQLPPAPDLPLAPNRPARPGPLPPAELPASGSPGGPGGTGAGEPRRLEPLRRIATRLGAAQWGAFRRNAAAAGLPVGTALLCLFVETLQRWSDGAAGLLTVLAAHRPPGHPEVGAVWGNASTTVLLGYAARQPGQSFAVRGRRLQGELYAALAAREISGVEVGRSMQRLRGETGNPAPVVFTSGLGLLEPGPAGQGGGFLLPMPGAELVRSAISTPQVLLDHQVFEEGAELVGNLDFAAAHYPGGLVDAMRAYHEQRLRALAADASAWHETGPAPLPQEQLAARRLANATAADLPRGSLHSFVLDRCHRTPDAIAVIDEDGPMSYASLDRASAALAARLGAGPLGAEFLRAAGRGLVAVRRRKGRAQVIEVLAVLRAGCAYLPIDARWPAARVRTILEHSGAMLLDDATARDTGTTAELDVEPAPEQTAYVIYTSGSTGTPKGVVISHGAAVNTVQDLTARFALTPDDRVLAVSSLAFDLSVFDLFGLLGAGGAVVLPPETANPDPQRWAELVAAQRVTVWNSVPALLDLTLEYLGAEAARALASLRLILLSGDWVPLPLVERLAALCPGAEVIALGGATEASIWSNWHPAADRPAGWSSVPYGRPLANQSMHVLSAELADAPEWVAGDLHLGGAGVADGYLHEPQRTAAAFYPHPRSGEPLYRTGDRARYRGGLVEFLGRNDHQVKVDGHRIELGEIETALRAETTVDAAVALVDPAGRLVAFVTGDDGIDPDALRAALAARLPAYMVPRAVTRLDALPLSGNGKVDRKALRELAGAGPAGPARAAVVAPAGPVEQRLLALWRELLGPAVHGVTDDFFAAGGNSLLAVRLFRQIESVFDRRLPLASLFRHATVRGQAALVTEGLAAGGPLVTIVPGPPHARTLVVIHPVGGDLLCYRDVLTALAGRIGDVAVYGLRASGLAEGETPAADLDTMAADYAAALAGRAGPPSEPGPLHLFGWSMGGTVALHVAAHLHRLGVAVASVTAADAFTGRDDEDSDGAEPDTDQERAAFVADLAATGADPGGELDERLFAVYRNNAAILRRHRPGAWHPPVCLLLRATRTGARHFPRLQPLDERLGIAATPLDEDHYSIVRGPGAHRMVDHLAAVLDAGAAPAEVLR
ncbi:amino acid adenylation domain-containing protein [Dactylosporangium vinaceum]|uniref:Non-ribosomal peptide synthetase n=1 Tax=Dactylosporangium vinaceum TaxID=53362 RepID=A0ABV5MSE8_9ACTN|nr:non-ribosomal peptide synthetase [Dactylosporangium vinaceum]UAC00192.1 amino acid adenylation domain-containing protein [Dactylosporangium vinaceum]